MAEKKKNPKFGGKRSLKDMDKSGGANFGDTFLGDLLGFDKDGGIGTKGKPGLLASLRGARRKKPGQVAPKRPATKKKPVVKKKNVTKPDLQAFSGSTDRKAAPKTKPKPKPKPKADPGRQTSPIPINKPTDKPMTLRTYLNTAIDKRGSTLSKEKAKGKNFKSIAAAKKGKSLYYMKGDKVMAAVYKEDLKK